MDNSQFTADEWHKELLTVAQRNAVQPRRWGMRVTVYADPTPANNGDFVLSPGLANLNRQDNANWLKVATNGQTWGGGGGGGSTSAKSQAFPYTGVESLFTVSNGTLDQINFVEVNGVVQIPSVNYTVTGQDVDFGSALPGTGTVVVYYYEDLSVGAGVQSVTGDGVDNIDPNNPILSFPTPGDIGAQTALGFTPENVANKATSFAVLNNNLYPSVQAVENRILDAIAGLKWKSSVRVATTVAGTLATSFENGDTVDGVVLATGDRILIKNQVLQTENGIYTVIASGAPTRSTDADTGAELEGAAVSALAGTVNANTTWIQITSPVTLGVSSIVFTQFGTSVPDASASVKGIAKLYPSTALGANTDGAPTQAAVKTYVDTAVAAVNPVGSILYLYNTMI